MIWFHGIADDCPSKKSTSNSINTTNYCCFFHVFSRGITANLAARDKDNVTPKRRYS